MTTRAKLATVVSILTFAGIAAGAMATKDYKTAATALFGALWTFIAVRWAAENKVNEDGA